MENINYKNPLEQHLQPPFSEKKQEVPGPIWIPLIPATMPSEKVEKFGKDVPLKRPGNRQSWHQHTFYWHLKMPAI